MIVFDEGVRAESETHAVLSSSSSAWRRKMLFKGSSRAESDMSAVCVRTSGWPGLLRGPGHTHRGSFGARCRPSLCLFCVELEETHVSINSTFSSFVLQHRSHKDQSRDQSKDQRWELRLLSLGSAQEDVINILWLLAQTFLFRSGNPGEQQAC